MMKSTNDIYFGMQFESRVFEGEEDSPLCSITIEMVYANDSSEAYDKLIAFGKNSGDIDWRFDKKCRIAYLGLVNLFHVRIAEPGFTLADLPPMVLSADKIKFYKRSFCRSCSCLVKPLIRVERNRLSSKSGFYEPMFSYGSQSKKCWFAAVCVSAFTLPHSGFVEVHCRVDCVFAPNPEAAFCRFKSRTEDGARKMAALSGKKCLFCGIWEIWPFYDELDDYGEIMELAHFFVSTEELELLKEKHVLRKEEITNGSPRRERRTIAFNPVFLQWKNMFGI